MSMKRIKLLAIASAGLLATPAMAANYVFNLSGNVSAGSTATVDSGEFRFTFFTIPLSNFGPTTFQVGDTVQATITLSQLLTVPTASVRNGIDLILLNTAYPGTSTDATGTTATFTGATPGLSGASESTSSSQLVNSLPNFTGTSFSFDSVQSDFTVLALGAATLPTDTAYFRYLTVDALPPAVPEPASWALLVLGFGAVGVTMRRRGPRPATA